MTKLFSKLQSFLEGRFHMLAALAVAMLLTAFSLEQYAIAVFVLWIAFVLVVDPNFTDIILPTILLNAIAIRTIGQTTYHTKLLWLAIPMAIAIILHFIIFPRKITIGKTFWPLCAVTVALLIGGVGYISKEEYFSISSLYFTVLLGVGMLFLYVWMRSHMYSTASYDLGERVLEILYFAGVFCAFSILEKVSGMLITQGELISFGWCNDVCEIMIFALPVPFFFARRRFIHFFVPFLLYFAMVPAKSMTAIGVGIIILALGIVYSFIYCCEKRIFIAIFSALLLAAGIGFLIYKDLFSFTKMMAFIKEEENGRTWLIELFWGYFKENPILGVGMGFGNSTSNVLDGLWAHNYIFQVLGSMGVVGVIAYGYQFFVRTRVVLKRSDALRWMLALSYFGIFAASMIQPGEFAPMPYEFLAVMLFVVLEKTEDGRCPRFSLDAV